MHLSKDDIPVQLAIPGATARQLPDFGTPTSTLGVEYFTLATGADMAPLLEGLSNDLCHAAHWGYLLSGRVQVTYQDGAVENVTEGDVFYWPPGHTVLVEDEAELVMFSPQVEHGEVLEHIRGKVAAMS